MPVSRRFRWEAFDLEVTEKIVDVGLKIRNLPSLRVAHISDFHESHLIPTKFLQEACEKTVTLKPEVICVTGDFISGKIIQREKYIDVLKILSQSVPTYACLGNHDGGYWMKHYHTHRGYWDMKEVTRLLEESGLQLLRNENTLKEINGCKVLITGLGDMLAHDMFPREVLIDLPKNDLHILMSHNPDTKDLVLPYDWDVMLSGHTHGGQVCFPLIGPIVLPIRDWKYYKGLHHWENRWLHITRGIGSAWAIRWNCRPEISMLTFV